jgi:Flp pilus assembly protein TadG
MYTKQLRKKASCDRRSGAAAVEFALIAPLFLMLLAGIMEFGQAFRIQHSLSMAARYGARAATIDGSTNDSVIQKVQVTCKNSLSFVTSDLTIEVLVNGSNADLSTAKTGDAITIIVSVPFAKAGVGFYAKMFDKKTLSSTCTLEHE